MIGCIARQKLVMVLGLCVVTVCGAADERNSPPTAVESLTQYLGIIAEANPQVAAAQANWRAAVEKLPQARSLPDPMLRFDYFGASVETRVGPQEYRVGLSQAFPYPGTLKQAETVAERAAKVKELNYHRVLRDVSIEVKVSYYELQYLRGALEITRQQQDLLQHILTLATVREADGKARFADVLRAQSQVAQLGYDTILLQELEVVETAKINALLARPSDTIIRKLAPVAQSKVTLSAAELEAIALGSRQELQMLAAAADVRDAKVGLAKLKNKPRFSLNAMRIETGEANNSALPDSGKDPWMIGVGVSIPLWKEKNRSVVREAEYLHQAAGLEHRALADRTRAMVKSAYFRLENARRLIALYDKSLIPQARQAMTAAEQWHDREKTDVSGFLETQSVWMNFNLARLRALADYQQYAARLERLLGMPMALAHEAAQAEPGKVEVQK